MEEKPKRRLLTKSTGQADLTGVKRPHRLAFCTSQQREVFSMQHDGSEIIQEKLQPALKTLRELSEQHQDDPESLLLLRRDLKPSTEASRTMRFGQAFRKNAKNCSLCSKRWNAAAAGPLSRDCNCARSSPSGAGSRRYDCLINRAA